MPKKHFDRFGILKRTISTKKPTALSNVLLFDLYSVFGREKTTVFGWFHTANMSLFNYYQHANHVWRRSRKAFNWFAFNSHFRTLFRVNMRCWMCILFLFKRSFDGFNCSGSKWLIILPQIVCRMRIFRIIAWIDTEKTRTALETRSIDSNYWIICWWLFCMWH